MPFTSSSAHLCFWLIGCNSEVPITPFLVSINLREQLTEIREKIYILFYYLLLIIVFIIWNIQMKELCLEKSMWEGGPQIPCPLQVHPCPSTIPEASSGRCNGSLTALGAFLAWRRAWQPTPVFSPGEFHGQCSLEDYCP